MTGFQNGTQTVSWDPFRVMACRNKAPITPEQEWLCLSMMSVHGGPRWASMSPRASYPFIRPEERFWRECLPVTVPLPVSLEQKSRKGSVLTRGRFQFCCQFTARESVGVELLEKRPETYHFDQAHSLLCPSCQLRAIWGLLPESSDALYLDWNHPPFINLFRSYPAHGIFSDKN